VRLMSFAFGRKIVIASDMIIPISAKAAITSTIDNALLGIDI